MILPRGRKILLGLQQIDETAATAVFKVGSRHQCSPLGAAGPGGSETAEPAPRADAAGITLPRSS
jgi:hypothetical protein